MATTKHPPNIWDLLPGTQPDSSDEGEAASPPSSRRGIPPPLRRENSLPRRRKRTPPHRREPSPPTPRRERWSSLPSQPIIVLSDSEDDNPRTHARTELPPGDASDSDDSPMILRARQGRAQTEVDQRSAEETEKSVYKLDVGKALQRMADNEVVDEEIGDEAPMGQPQQENRRPTGDSGESADAAPPRATGIWAIKPKKRAPAGPPSERPAKHLRLEPYPHASPVVPDGQQLTRQQVVDLENVGYAITTGLSRYRSLGAANITREQSWAIRAALHKAPFLPCNVRYRHKVTDRLEALISAAPEVQIPDDIVSDAKYLYDRWMREDFDPDLLRGIDKTLRVVDKKRLTTQSIDKDYKFKRSAGVPGHNGLVVGQWWPLQLCAVRDGAHGATEGGIYADREAAISVIVSGGGYKDVDKLNVIWYCGTLGDGPGLPSANTQAMLNAMKIRRHIRVFRSSKAPSVYAPAEGIRYDGLYSVSASEIIDNKHAMMRFKLVRCDDQPEVRWRGDGIRPTTVEREKWRDLKEMWKLMA
jgi:hypothetical protein